MNFYSMPRTGPLFAIILVALLLTDKAVGQSYTAEGTITYQTYDDDKIVMELERKLVAQVSGAKWLITIEATQMRSNGAPEIVCQAGFDGENVYCVDIPTGRSASDDAAVCAVASISPNQPLGSVPTVGATFAWFMFAPNSHELVFSNHLGQCIWEDVLLRKHNVRLPIAIWTNNNAGTPCTMVAWQNDGMLRAEDNRQNLIRKPMPEPYDKSYTNAIYTAINTNINGMQIATSASLTSYYPDYPSQNGSGRTIKQTAYYFRLISVVPQCVAAEFRPQLPPMTMVIDRRLMGHHPDYHPFKLATNGGAWSAIPLANLQSNYAFYTDNLKRHPELLPAGPVEHVLRARRQISVICMILAIITVFMLISRRTKTA